MPKKRIQSTNHDLEAEFKRLFWAARKEQTSLKVKATASDPECKRALEYAKAQGWQWAKNLIEASRLNRVEKHDKALELLGDCRTSIPKKWHSLFYFIQGAALSDLGKHDEAIKDYYKALKDKKFDRPERVWFNIGYAFAAKGQYDEAIKAYHKALKYPKFDEPGRIWFSTALALSAKGEHNEAIKAYRKVFDDPKFDAPGKVWNNLGNEFTAIGDFSEAIKAYLKALDDPKYDTPAKSLANLAQTYVTAGKPKLAEEAFKKAIASPDPNGSDHKRAEFGLRLLKAKISSSALSPDDRAFVEKSGATVPTDEDESPIIAAIQEAGDTQYDKYIGKPDSKRDDTLSILRGWSSAVTLLEGSERRWRGGGYFLKWRGCGFVIDPGFDFLRNFHDAGYHGREIRAVMVSHHHPDHNSDLKDIDDLRYELYKRLAAQKSPGSEPYVLLWDQDTSNEIKFGITTPAHHEEPIVFASGYPQPINLADHKAKLPVRIIPFKVNHGGDVPHAMGMVIELLDKKDNPALRIGYTADTAYFDELHKHLAGCDILIAHISQPSIDELKDASKLKDVHLGYRGTARLLKECKPKLTLIGEFWAGFTDLRIALVKGLRRQSGVESILPTGLAMHVKLPSLEIECTECGKPTPFAKVKVAPPTDNFGSLAYLCPRCLLQ